MASIVKRQEIADDWLATMVLAGGVVRFRALQTGALYLYHKRVTNSFAFLLEHAAGEQSPGRGSGALSAPSRRRRTQRPALVAGPHKPLKAPHSR